MGLLLAWLKLWGRLLKRREWSLIRYYLLGQRQRGEFLYLRPAFDGGKDKDWLMSRVVPITTSQTESRIRGYVAAGDIKLSKEDIEAIDKEGKRRDRVFGFNMDTIAAGLGYILMTVFLYKLYDSALNLA
jgi:hypothetical protein